MPEAIATTQRRTAPLLTPPLPLARARLAEAQARVREAEAALERVRAAQERVDSVAALMAVDAAEERLAEARKAEPQRLVTALIDGADTTTGSVLLAERDLKRARAEHARAREAEALLAAEEQKVAAQLGMRRGFLQDAVGAALRAAPEVAELLEAYRAAERRFAELRACVAVVARASGVPAGHERWQSPRFGPYSAGDDPDKLPAVAVWREAVADLADDAGAALPEV